MTTITNAEVVRQKELLTRLKRHYPNTFDDYYNGRISFERVMELLQVFPYRAYSGIERTEFDMLLNLLKLKHAIGEPI